MKKMVLMVVAMAAALPSMAQQPQKSKALQSAADRLSRPLESQAMVSAAAGHTVSSTSSQPGISASTGAHVLPHRAVPVRVNVHPSSQSGYFETSLGICSFRFAVGKTEQSGPINVQCPGNERGTGGWVLQPDGSVFAHVKTTNGREYNFKL
jgi:Ni/Co efflux regulator RcnB